MRKALKYILAAGLALGSALPMARGQASAANMLEFFEQETNEANYKITQRLKNTTDKTPFDPDWKYHTLDLDAGLVNNGCTNIENNLDWKYQDVSQSVGQFTSTNTTYLAANSAEFFYYQIPTNSVIGWHFVPATFTANNGDTANLDGGFKVPITRQMKTSEGINFGWLYDRGFVATNSAGSVTNTADFEIAAGGNADGDGYTNGEEYIAGTNPLIEDGLEGVINPTTNGVEVSVSPAVTNRVYNVYSNTNLTEGVGFEKVGSYTNNATADGKFLDERDLDAAFYRAGVALP